MKRSLCIVLLLAAGLARAAEPGDKIAYWTTAYQGEDLVSGQFACKRPIVAGWSTSKEDIAAVQQRLDAWRDCYQRFAANINARTAAGTRIPSEVLALMTPAQVQQAQRHVDAVYAGLVAQARKDAAQVAADVQAWQAGTEYYVENSGNPSNGMLSGFRNMPQPGMPNSWIASNSRMKAPPLAPTGVLH